MPSMLIYYASGTHSVAFDKFGIFSVVPILDSGSNLIVASDKSDTLSVASAL